VQELVLPLLAPLARHVLAGLEDGHQVVLDRQLPNHAGILGQVTHASAGAEIHGQPADVASVGAALAVVGVGEPDRPSEASRLARPLGTEQAAALSLTDVVVDPADPLPASVPLLKAADLQDWHRSILLDRARSGRTMSADPLHPPHVRTKDQPG